MNIMVMRRFTYHYTYTIMKKIVIHDWKKTGDQYCAASDFPYITKYYEIGIFDGFVCETLFGILCHLELIFYITFLSIGY